MSIRMRTRNQNNRTVGVFGDVTPHEIGRTVVEALRSNESFNLELEDYASGDLIIVRGEPARDRRTRVRQRVQDYFGTDDAEVVVDDVLKFVGEFLEYSDKDYAFDCLCTLFEIVGRRGTK